MKQKKRKVAQFAKLCEELQHHVYKVCLYYTKDEVVAEEIAQRVFFNIYTHLDRIDLENITPYAFRTARNMSYNWANKFKRLQDGQIEDVADEYIKILSVEDTYIRQFEIEMAREFSDSVLTHLYAKNRDWYEVIMMAYYFEMPQGEIAEELGVDRYAVSSKLYRAKKWIRKNYQEEYEQYRRKVEGL